MGYPTEEMIDAIYQSKKALDSAIKNAGVDPYWSPGGAGHKAFWACVEVCEQIEAVEAEVFERGLD